MTNREKALELINNRSKQSENFGFNFAVTDIIAKKAVEVASEKEEILETIEEALNNSKCWTKIAIQGIKTNIIIEKDNEKI